MLFKLILMMLSLAYSLKALSLVSECGKPEIPRLQFTDNGTFKLAIFEDLHYGEAEDLSWGPEQDLKSTKVINGILSNESPQLVVLNGDLITGENTFLENSSSYFDVIVAPLIEHNVLWASAYGNHDSDFNLSREAIFEREQTYANSLTQRMVEEDSAGISNYYLLVYPSDSDPDDDEDDDVPALILWFFDSRGGSHFRELDDHGKGVPHPNWVDESVVEWFVETNADLVEQYDEVIPSLAFFHIPVNAMLAFQDSGVNPNTEPGINDDVPLAQQGMANGQGQVSGRVFNYTGQDIAFMEALRNTEGLMATFSGHDHGNDWCFKWDKQLPGMNLTGNGMHMCFGRHTGYGGYGTWTRGSRQILLDEETLGDEVITWVRLEDGTITGMVTLNDTYGDDKYPAVNNTSSP